MIQPLPSLFPCLNHTLGARLVDTKPPRPTRLQPQSCCFYPFFFRFFRDDPALLEKTCFLLFSFSSTLLLWLNSIYKNCSLCQKDRVCQKDIFGGFYPSQHRVEPINSTFGGRNGYVRLMSIFKTGFAKNQLTGGPLRVSRRRGCHLAPFCDVGVVHIYSSLRATCAKTCLLPDYVSVRA